MANVLMAPGALDAQQEEIQRRLKFAEALQNPTAEQGRMVGNHFVSFNPLAGLADILRAKIGADERKGAEQELKNLGIKRQEMMSNALKTFGQLSNPSQAGTGATNLVNDALPPEMQIGAQPQIAQRKPDMQGAYASLIESGIPALQQMGTQGMIQLPQIAAQQQERKDAREAAHAQQMEVLKQRAEDARSTMQERLQAQREMQANQLEFQRQNAEANRAQQASMARLTAALRPEKMVTVLGGSGEAVTLPQSQAAGMQLYNPQAAKQIQQQKAQGEAKQQLSDAVSELAKNYENLNKNGGITSTSKGLFGNLGAAASSSSLGQALGGAVGSENQSERQKIEQTRPLLINLIKNATGMSAQQMNSNAEMNMYLRAATDPKLGYEANMNALKNLDKMFGLGLQQGAETTKPSTPAGMPSADAIAAEIARRRGGK